jgi:predicted permease
MQKLVQDIRYAFRLLLKRPGFTLAVVLSLGLGIGVNTTIFSLVNAILLRPVPGVKDADGLFELYTSYTNGMRFGAVSYLDYADMRDRNQSLSGLMAQRLTLLNLSEGGDNELVPGAVVSGNYFDVLGVEAAHGRTFLPEEDRTPDTHPVAVISHGLWQRRFGANPALVNQTITVNARKFTVVGIAPEGFSGATVGFAGDVWVPLMMESVAMPGADRLKERGTRWLEVVGRVKPGVSLEQAQSSMEPIIKQLAEENPNTNRQTGVNIVALGQGSAGIQSTVSPVLKLLMVVVVLVLLIACFNVANLLLARATARRREIGIRLALGASRVRLVRQLLTESLLLALLGGVLGIILAYWTLNLLLAFKPPTSFPLLLDLRLDWRVLTFTAVVSVLTGLIFGLAPAIQTTRAELVPALKDEASAQGYRRSYLRNALVVAQVATSFVLLIGAGLFIRSLQQAQSSSTGFESQNLLIASADVGLGGYDQVKGALFYQQLLERVGALPGVRSTSLAKAVPLEVGSTQQIGVAIEGFETPNRARLAMDYNIVSPGYFRTLGIPLNKGRDFEERDTDTSPGVVIVNEALARRFWPNQEALGKRVSVGNRTDPLEVIGVAKNSKYYSLQETPRPFIYVPFSQFYRPGMTLHVNSAGDPALLLAEVRKQVLSLDRGVPLFNVKTMTEHLGVALIVLRAAALLLGVFGLLALALATLGLYAVMAYSVTQRKREIGIRMALGAQRGHVLKLVLRQGMFLTGIGLVIGAVAAFGLTRFVSTLLYGTEATDLWTFAVVSVLLAGVALLASFLPAWRATKVNPMIALRYE